MMGPELLGRLVDQHGPALVLYARQWCSAPEDVVQEAFLKLVRHRPPPTNAVAWLYKVVRNASISAGRSAQRRMRHENQAALQRAEWFLPTERGMIDEIEARQALEHLGEDLREIITLHLWGGLTFEQIAEVTGLSSSTAHRRYLAGLESLRERLRIHVRTSTR